jgi:hypothetical protein
LTIIDKGIEVARVEVYCPLKGMEAWYQTDIVEPWQRLLKVRDRRHLPGAARVVTDISIDPGAMTDAVTRLLTDGNFPGQKARQLAAGGLPTLLAVRGYGLTPRREEIFTMRCATDLAERVGDAWQRLPPLCGGLLICFIGDVLDLSRKAPPCMLVPTPGFQIPDGLWAYCDRAWLLGTDVAATRTRGSG